MPRRTTPEGAVQAAVLDYLALLEMQGRLMFWRQNNTGVWDERKQCYRKPTGVGFRPGVPDIAVVLKGGRFLGLECKAPKGTQSDPQKAFQRQVNALGGRYYVVRSVDEAVAALADAVSP